MFFNSMNLDTKYGCGHFGSKFPLNCDLIFRFPTLFSFPPCLNQDKVLSLTALPAQRDICLFTMKRTSTESFNPLPQETLPKVSNYLSLYVALNPTQFAQLQNDQPILPDPYSERFAIKAAERACYFMSWAPSYCDAPEPTQIKKYMICKIGIAGVGYMFLTQNGILQKGDGSDPFRPGYIAGMDPCTSA